MGEQDPKRQLSRRDFFRIAGITTGAAVATTLVKTEGVQAAAAGKLSDPAGRPPRPWWVKTVDQPTTEIDWAKMQRYNEREGTVRQSLAKYVGKEKVDEWNKIAAQNEKDRMLNNVDGYTLKDQALAAAHVGVGRSFLGPQKVKTPEERGVPKWTGSPEEAAKILRAALRHMGAATIGFIELNENTKKLIYSNDPDGLPLSFEDVDKPAETKEKRVIPNKAKYVVVYTVQMSEETMKRSPTVTGSQTTTLAYKRGESIQASLQEFLRGLGYMGLGESATNALGIAPAFGVLAGLGEMSRLNRLITPEFGPMVRVFKLLTDLPVAVDKPINAGIMEFCRACKKCAEACPSEALSFEKEPTWNVRGGWNNAGHKAFFEDATKCREYWITKAGTNCGICFAVCPFAKKDKAWIHTWVKSGISALPFMNNFYRSMDDAFGYGIKKNSEEWWSLDLPEYGIDSAAMVKE